VDIIGLVLLPPALCENSLSNKNWKCISSGIDERHAGPLWHFHDFGAVMQISRFDYLYILRTKYKPNAIFDILPTVLKTDDHLVLL